MKVLITGAKGQVGCELLQGELADKLAMHVVGFDRASLDITDYAQVDTILQREQPDVVINAAAYTAVDKAEQDIEQAYAINRDGPANLAKVCNALHIPLIHISTDYVFDGDKKTPYLETDLPNPTGVYGKSKLAGELAIADILKQHYIVRVAWVFGAHGNNFAKTMLKLGKERSELSVVADQKGSPTWAKDIAEVVLTLAKQTAVQPLDWGIYHYAGAKQTTWFAFAQHIFETAADLKMITAKPQLLAITSEQYPTPAQRPQNSVLDCNKIKAALNVEPSNWQVGLKNVLTTWKST
jgi:dTDP-4-dehydrorhamnose reductase